MNEGQRDVLLSRARRGDRDAEAQLLVGHERIIAGIARNWRIPGVSEDDVLQESRLAALTAIREYDPARGDLVAFMRRCIPRHLQKVKESRRASTDEPTEFEIAVAPRLPARELDIIRTVWPHFTDAERRGVLVMLRESGASVAAENLGVSKQAVSHGWTEARRLIQLAVAEGMGAVAAVRPKPRSSSLDWQLEDVLSRLQVD